MRKLLRLKKVIETTGRCRSGIYSDVKAGTFPPPIKISERCIAWFEDVIEKWMEERAAASKPTPLAEKRIDKAGASPPPGQAHAPPAKHITRGAK